MNFADNAPEEIINDVIDDVPEFYKTQEQFINCKKHLDNLEPDLALQCLINMANESGHFFANNFWNMLAKAADKMKLVAEGNLCRAQIIKNQKSISWIISKGSTVCKIDDTHYNHYYSQKTLDNWDNERRIKDKLQSFINIDGFHFVNNGRDGMLYYILKGKVCEIYWEMSGVPQYDIIISLDLIDSWALPVKQLLSESEKKSIEKDLLIWLSEHKVNAEIYPKRIGATQ